MLAGDEARRLGAALAAAAKLEDIRDRLRERRSETRQRSKSMSIA